MMRTLCKKAGPGIVALGVLVGCSSKPKSGDSPDPGPSVVSAGLVTFFEGVDEGVVVSRIDWTQPIGSENPGVDCPLRLKKEGPPVSTYVCVVRKEGEAPVVATLQQSEGEGGARRLSKIFVDAKGAKTVDRWTADLAAAGYREIQKPGKKAGWKHFESVDGKTEASLVHVAAKQAVTLILAPK